MFINKIPPLDEDDSNDVDVGRSRVSNEITNYVAGVLNVKEFHGGREGRNVQLDIRRVAVRIDLESLIEGWEAGVSEGQPAEPYCGAVIS
jgi:hypothetical protein